MKGNAVIWKLFVNAWHFFSCQAINAGGWKKLAVNCPRLLNVKLAEGPIEPGSNSDCCCVSGIHAVCWFRESRSPANKHCCKESSLWRNFKMLTKLQLINRLSKCQWIPQKLIASIWFLLSRLYFSSWPCDLCSGHGLLYCSVYYTFANLIPCNVEMWKLCPISTSKEGFFCSEMNC